MSGLRRFSVFSELSPVDLATATAQARKLSLPAGRWLVRPGRELTGSYFLDRGSVRLYEPDSVVEEWSARAHFALYPGARGVATLRAVDLLQVDVESLVGVFASVDESALPLCEPNWLTEGWESRFLGTHIMQRLRPAQWQRILRGMRRIVLSAGEPIVTEGESGHDFYVLCAGRAEVRSAGRCVARLEPGGFFGEDAPITGTGRNATVAMLNDGSVLALSAGLFRSDLRSLCLAPRVGQGSMIQIDISDGPGNGSLRVPLRELRERLVELDPGKPYRIVGGSASQRALAAFIFAQRGISGPHPRLRAKIDQAGTVLPLAHARSPSMCSARITEIG
ncbi:MAG: cyclic nucleotide-binding domain-containing protein [Pseudomonadales bacterium]